jgi:hypothetical protein
VFAAVLFVVCSALCSAGLLDRTGERSLSEPQLWLAAQPTPPLQVVKVSTHAPEVAKHAALRAGSVASALHWQGFTSGLYQGKVRPNILHGFGYSNVTLHRLLLPFPFDCYISRSASIDF